MMEEKQLGRLHRTWIWFWYSDITRMFFVLLPGHFLVTIPILLWLHVDDTVAKNILTGTYLLVFFWALFDNDFENLRKIGLDPYRKPIPKEAD